MIPMDTLIQVFGVVATLAVQGPQDRSNEIETAVDSRTCGWCAVALGPAAPFLLPASRDHMPVLWTAEETRPSAAEYTAFAGFMTGFVAAFLSSVYIPKSTAQRRILRWSATGALGGFAIGKLIDALTSDSPPTADRHQLTPD